VRIAACLLTVGAAAEVAAQPPQPVGPYVIDARGSFVRFKEDGAIANTIDVSADNLPTRGLGITTGAHWYPVRWRRVAFGLGAELLLARDSRTKEATETTEAGPTVTTRLSALSPHLSLNFGKGDGWSYISGGFSSARLTVERTDRPAIDVDRTRATHYGAGARWFTSRRLAVSVDVRFYAINARPPTGTLPQFPRNRLTVFSAGIAVR
jgi:hypothetical protein